MFIGIVDTPGPGSYNFPSDFGSPIMKKTFNAPYPIISTENKLNSKRLPFSQVSGQVDEVRLVEMETLRSD